MGDVVEEEAMYSAEKSLPMGERKDKGLADVEVGSACYMSEMLNFNFEEYDDCEELKEDDLLSFNDPFIKKDLKVLYNYHFLLGAPCKKLK